jgi:hypothetical protein
VTEFTKGQRVRYSAMADWDIEIIAVVEQVQSDSRVLIRVRAADGSYTLSAKPQNLELLSAVDQLGMLADEDHEP